MSGLIGAAIGFAVVRPDTIIGFYDAVYPQNAAERQALDLCFQQDHEFNRLDGAERAHCYRSMLPWRQAEADPAGVEGRAVRSANFVDLWRAAGRGHMPTNDVRAQEQAARVLHPAAARVAR